MISIVIISKDEPSLDETLRGVTAQAEALDEACEVVVVDASGDRLAWIRDKYEASVRWTDFKQPAGTRITIPHQRNAGVREARGDMIVFTDAGCVPEARWLERLAGSVRRGEHVACGLTLSTAQGVQLHDEAARKPMEQDYLPECGTGNLAFRREVYDQVGGFDEAFQYGSDTDFSWRVLAAGYRIRAVPGAVVRHDWGTPRRQARRAFQYGRARTRLYRKHPRRLRHVIRQDPTVAVYPLFLLGLPLTFVFPLYPALLLIPAWRNRASGPVLVIIDHLVFGAGILAELAGL